ANALNFDINTLSIDALSNRIGIGTTNPNYQLDVNGTAGISGTLAIGGTTTSQGIEPSLDSTYNLGAVAKRYKDVYAVTYHGDGSQLSGIAATTTLDAAYEQTNGNNITTSDARNIEFNLDNTATDSNFLVNILSGSVGYFSVQNTGTDVLKATANQVIIGSNSVYAALEVTQSGSGNIVNFKDGTTSVFTIADGGDITLGSAADITLSAGNLSINQLATPSGVIVTSQGTTGSTTYSYRISALNANGETLASSTAQTTTGNATLSGTNFNRITWNSVTGASSYKVYGRTLGSELYMITASGLTWDDIGSVTPSGALPSVNDTGGSLNVARKIYNSTGDFIVIDDSVDVNGTNLTLDADSTSTGGTTVRIIAEQGTDNNGIIQYNAANNQWELANDGTNFNAIATSASASTLQSAYTNSGRPATITTTDGKDIKFNLDNTETDSNFIVNIATSSTGNFKVQSAGTDVFKVANNTITASQKINANLGLEIQGGDLIITNNKSFNQSSSSGTFSTGTGVVSLKGDTTIVDGKTFTVGTTQPGAGASTFNGVLNVNNIATIGDGDNTVTINSSDWDITATGVMSGISGITNNKGYIQETNTAQNTFIGNIDAQLGLDVTGNVLSVDVSNGNPALSVTQNGGGNVVDFKDGVTSVFRILDGGNVGIGDTTPAATLTVGDGDKFQVAGATGNITTAGDLAVNGGDLTSTGALTVTPAAGTNLNVNLSGAGDFAVNTNQLYVDTSAGKVGIGVASPLANLSVK
ncbi:MAG: hypothetical protein AAB526_01515, partial [Patescibacteria group bacterium]